MSSARQWPANQPTWAIALRTASLMVQSATPLWASTRPISIKRFSCRPGGASLPVAYISIQPIMNLYLGVLNPYS